MSPHPLPRHNSTAKACTLLSACKSSTKLSCVSRKATRLRKVFFYLEQEVMKPRYESTPSVCQKSSNPPRSIKTTKHPQGARNPRPSTGPAARALFSATEIVTQQLPDDFGKDVPMTKYANT